MSRHKILALIILSLLCIASASAIGLSPAKKIYNDNPYTLHVLGSPQEEVVLTAPEGVVLSETRLTLDDAGSSFVRVNVDMDVLIPGLNELYIVATGESGGDGQIVVRPQVAHLLTVYKDSDEDYIIYRPHFDAQEGVISVFGQVMSHKSIPEISLSVTADGSTASDSVFDIESKEEFVLRVDTADLDISSGYHTAFYTLTYGTKRDSGELSFLKGAPRIYDVRLGPYDGSKGIVAIPVSFTLDWNRNLSVFYGEAVFSSGQSKVVVTLPGGSLTPGKNELTLAVDASRFIDAAYAVALSVDTQDGAVSGQGAFRPIISVEPEKRIRWWPWLLLLLLILLVAILIRYRSYPTRIWRNLKREFLLKKQPKPRHKRIRW